MRCPRCAKEIWYMSSGAILVCADCPLTLEQLPRDPLLVEREKTHGSFAANAKISQMIKAIYKDYDYDERLPFEQREALDMIALKISRILSGQHNERDHWKDGSGYFKLGEEACDQTRSS